MLKIVRVTRHLLQCFHEKKIYFEYAAIFSKINTFINGYVFI